MTRSAIRQFQKANNLNANGRLDRATCGQLGSAGNGQANRSSNEPATQNNNNNSTAQNGSNTANTGSNAPMSNSEFKANVQSAQRQLKQKGFYSGPVNGFMDAKTESGIRKFQESNGLNVTGKLDQGTLNSLGISKQQ